MSTEYSFDPPLATVTINRPDQMNSLDEPTRLALAQTISQAAADPAVKVIVLTGSGRAFCAGQDLSAVHELDDAYDTVARTYNPVILAITEAEVPVVAAINGPAVGAGMGIALACDVVIMSEKSSFACAFGAVGLVPDSGTTWFLSRTLGHQRAFDIASTGRKIAADEAVHLGLATETVPPDGLLPRTYEIARKLAEGASLALKLMKSGMRAAHEQTLAESLEQEAQAQGAAADSTDHVELRESFFRRRR